MRKPTGLKPHNPTITVSQFYPGDVPHNLDLNGTEEPEVAHSDEEEEEESPAWGLKSAVNRKSQPRVFLSSGKKKRVANLLYRGSQFSSVTDEIRSNFNNSKNRSMPEGAAANAFAVMHSSNVKQYMYVRAS